MDKSKIKSRIKRKNELKIWYENKKGEQKCENCGFDNPKTLNWYNKGKKNVERLIKLRYSEDQILEEMKKGQILCYNCYAILQPEEPTDNVEESIKNYQERDLKKYKANRKRLQRVRKKISKVTHKEVKWWEKSVPPTRAL